MVVVESLRPQADYAGERHESVCGAHAAPSLNGRGPDVQVATAPGATPHTFQ